MHCTHLFLTTSNRPLYCNQLKHHFFFLVSRLVFHISVVTTCPFPPVWPDVGIKSWTYFSKNQKRSHSFIFSTGPFFKIAQKVAKYLWAVFVINFVNEDFQKPFNLVTLISTLWNQFDQIKHWFSPESMWWSSSLRLLLLKLEKQISGTIYWPILAANEA